MKRFDVQVLLDLVDRFSGPLKSGPMKQLTALQKQSEITDRSMNRMFTGGGLIAAGAALGAPLIFSFNAASDLSEALNKNQVVFGQHARMVQRWANTSSTAFGQARVDALGTVGTFGNLFTSMGLGQRRAAGLSMDIVQLGGDLASFNNTSPTDALDALRSGLVGEIEPLRRYGVNLSAAAVAQKAFAMGLTPKVMNATEINPATKALATYQIILEQTKNAQGDYARTADGSANALRTILALMKDLRTTVGSQLEPVFRPLILAFRDLLVFVNRLAQANPVLTRVLAVTTLGLAALLTLVGFGIVTVAGLTLAMSQARIGLITMRSALRGAVGGMIQFVTAGVPTSVQMQMMATRSGRLSLALQGVRARFLASAAAARAFTVSLLTNPVFLLIAAIVALGVSFVWAWRKSDDFRTGVMRGLEPIRRSWAGLKDDVAALGQSFAPLGATFSRVTQAIGLDLTKIKGPLDALGYAFGYFIGFVGTGLAITFGRTIAFLVTGFSGLVQTINGLVTAGQGLVSLDFAKMNTGLSQARGGLEQTLLAPLELAGVDTRQFRADLGAANRNGKTIWERIGGWLGHQWHLTKVDFTEMGASLDNAYQATQNWGEQSAVWVGQRFQTARISASALLGSLRDARAEGRLTWRGVQGWLGKRLEAGTVKAGAFFASLREGQGRGASIWERVNDWLSQRPEAGKIRPLQFFDSLRGAVAKGRPIWQQGVKKWLGEHFQPPKIRPGSLADSLVKAAVNTRTTWAGVSETLTERFQPPKIRPGSFFGSLREGVQKGGDIWGRVPGWLGRRVAAGEARVGSFLASLREGKNTGGDIWGHVTRLLSLRIRLPGVNYTAVETSLGDVLKTIQDFGPQMLEAGRGMIDSLVAGLKEKVGDITAFFESIKLPNWIPGINRKDEATSGGRSADIATKTNPTASLAGIANRSATPAAVKMPGIDMGTFVPPDYVKMFGVNPGQEIGAALVYGIENGMITNKQAARFAVRSLSEDIVGELRAALQIRSPSRVFANLGGFIPQGLGQGIMGQRSAVTKAMQTLAAAAVAVPITPVLGTPDAPGFSLGGPPPLTRSIQAAPNESQGRTASGTSTTAPTVHKTYSFAGANFNLDMSEIRGKEDFMGKLEELFQWFGEDE